MRTELRDKATRRGEQFFAAKAWLGGVGVIVGLLGMATERRWLVWAAVVVLALAVALRLAHRKRHGAFRPPSPS